MGLIVSTLVLPLLESPDLPFPIPDEYLPLISAMIVFKAVISTVNFALILCALAIYYNIYRAMRTRFTLGLLMMIIALMMNAFTSNPLLQFRFGGQFIGLGPLTFLPDVFTTITLIVLLYISLE
jgi:hypothetical protein